MKTIYSIDDISKMTMLSTRTIRNYIKLGLLNGSKTNGYWQFTSDDISKFINNDYVTQSLNTKRNSLIYDYILNDCKSIKSVWSTFKFLQGDGSRHCLFLHAPFVTCFLQAGPLKFAVGPPTSWIYPLKSFSSVMWTASFRIDS